MAKAASFRRIQDSKPPASSFHPASIGCRLASPRPCSPRPLPLCPWTDTRGCATSWCVAATEFVEDSRSNQTHHLSSRRLFSHGPCTATACGGATALAVPLLDITAPKPSRRWTCSTCMICTRRHWLTLGSATECAGRARRTASHTHYTRFICCRHALSHSLSLSDIPMF